MLSIDKSDLDDLPEVFSELEVLLGEIIDSDHAYDILEASIKKAKGLPKVLGQLKHLQSQINPEDAYNLLSAAIEYEDDLPAVFSASEVLLGKITDSGCAYNICLDAIEQADDLPSVFSELEVLLGKIAALIMLMGF